MLTRRRFVAGMAAASAGSLLSPLSVLGRPSLSILNFTPIRRGVGTYTERGGTIGYLATPEALVVVDSQYADTAATCLKGLQEQTDRRIDVLVNTHHHGDHTAGNPVLAPVADLMIGHANVPELMASRATADSPATPPTTTYQETWKTQVGDEVLSLTHFGPAHTKGDSVVYFEKADIVHMGDLVFNRMPPFIDRPGGASIAGWIDTMESVHARFTDDTVFIYGHGAPNHGIVGTRDDLLAMRDFLSGLMDYVQRGLAEGKTADEIAAVDRLPDFPEYYRESWQAAIPNAIRTAHSELTSND